MSNWHQTHNAIRKINERANDSVRWYDSQKKKKKQKKCRNYKNYAKPDDEVYF